MNSRSASTLATQWREWSRLLLVANILAFVILCVVVALRGVAKVSFYDLTADATVLPPNALGGFLSNLGFLAWAAGVAVALFGAWLARPPYRSFLLFAAALTTFLALDDVLLLHDVWAPRIGLSESWLVVGIAMVVGAFLVSQHKTLPHTPWLILGLALAGFGAMTLFDVIEHYGWIWEHHFWEEGAKFAGIVNWTAYLTGTAAMALKHRDRHLGIAGADEVPHQEPVEGLPSARSPISKADQPSG